MRVPGVGQTVFAATFIALGLVCLACPDWAGVWQPVPRSWPWRPAVLPILGLVSLAGGAGLLRWGVAAPAAALLSGALLVWMLAVKVAPIVASGSAAAWESWGETAAPLAAAWSLFVRRLTDRGRARLGRLAGAPGEALARVLFANALLAFGASHLAYIGATAALVPAWLPGRALWAVLTGGAYVAAGVAILTRVLARLAALLVTLQMGLFTLLVWVPRLATGGSAADWGEAVISWTLTASGWAVADTYRGAAWLGVREWGARRLNPAAGEGRRAR